MKTITLRYPTSCRHCGAHLEPGQRATWVGRGRVYGLTCHDKASAAVEAPQVEDEPLGLTYSRFDKFGLYAHDGRKIATSCHCIDYPCCGH